MQFLKSREVVMRIKDSIIFGQITKLSSGTCFQPRVVTLVSRSFCVHLLEAHDNGIHICSLVQF